MLSKEEKKNLKQSRETIKVVIYTCLPIYHDIQESLSELSVNKLPIIIVFLP